MSGTRLAFRLARRDVRRRPLRAALVVLLVAVPVFALTVADVLIESEVTRSPEQRFAAANGAASFVYDDVTMDATLAPAGTPQFTPPLPVGSRAVAYRSGTLPLTPRSGLRARDVQVTDAGADALGFTGARLLDGRAPRAGEVALSEVLARSFGVGIGDRLVLSRPVMNARVVGITESTADSRRALLDAPSFPFDAVRTPGLVGYRVPVVLPARASLVDVATRYEVQQLRLQTPAGIRPIPTVVVRPGVAPTSNVLTPEFGSGSAIDSQAKFWSWVGVALLLAMIAVIIAAAFATTARRQLVVLGQLAANGGRPAFLRRMLTLQGTMLGVIGAVTGMAAALLGLELAHGWIDDLFHHEVHYLLTWDLVAIAVTAVLAATFAARFPARTASRVPVLSALAGRRPLAPVPRLAWLRAVVVFVAGVGLLLLVVAIWSGTAAQLRAAIAILGGLLVLAGAAMLTPSVVALTARLGDGLGVAGRLGTRSLVRVRSRSAAIVTAVAVAGTVAVAVVTGMLGLGIDQAARSSVTSLPANVVIGQATSAAVFAGGAVESADAGTLVRGARLMRQVVPGVEIATMRQIVTVVSSDGGPAGPTVGYVADPDLVRVLALDAGERRELARTGVLMTPSPFGAGTRTVEVSGPEGSELIPEGRTAPPSSLVSRIGLELLVAPDLVARTSAPTGVSGLLGIAPDAISRAQVDALGSHGFVSFADPYGTVPESGSESMYFSARSLVSPYWRGIWSPVRLQVWFSLGALAFVLVVVAIGLLLGRSEGRDEREVLEALGARPATERRIAAVQAGALALGGGLIAVVAGWVPMAALFRAVQEPWNDSSFNPAVARPGALYPLIRFPWGTSLGVVVAIPLIVAAGAWLVTAAAQRTRPLRASVFGSD